MWLEQQQATDPVRRDDFGVSIAQPIQTAVEVDMKNLSERVDAAIGAPAAHHFDRSVAGQGRDARFQRAGNAACTVALS